MANIHLSSKFEPSILGNQADQPELIALKGNLDEIFRRSAEGKDPLDSEGFEKLEGKAHVVAHKELPNWIIKGQRHDQIGQKQTPDTHIYRVRRALKIAQIIDSHNMTELVVPKKYLYEHKGQWFVVAEKLDLQKGALAFLGSKATEQLALLTFKANLEDLDTANSHNICQTTKGKIALPDTEPTNRAIRKQIRKYTWPFALILPSFNVIKHLNMQVAILSTTKLANYNFFSRKEIVTIHEREILTHLKPEVVKIALTVLLAFGCYFAAMQTDEQGLMSHSISALAQLAAVSLIFRVFLNASLPLTLAVVRTDPGRVLFGL